MPWLGLEIRSLLAQSDSKCFKGRGVQKIILEEKPSCNSLSCK